MPIRNRLDPFDRKGLGGGDPLQGPDQTAFLLVAVELLVDRHEPQQVLVAGDALEQGVLTGPRPALQALTGRKGWRAPGRRPGATGRLLRRPGPDARGPLHGHLRLLRPDAARHPRLDRDPQRGALPWVSPAGRVNFPAAGGAHIIDGGYFDAGGVETAREFGSGRRRRWGPRPCPPALRGRP